MRFDKLAVGVTSLVGVYLYRNNNIYCEKPVLGPNSGELGLVSELRRETVPVSRKEAPTLFRKLASEALGTGLIVLLGCGSVASVKYLGSGMTLGGASIIWGTAVALSVYATRDVSGAHLNPAVTMALAFHRPESCPPYIALSYIGAQVFGAASAAFVNYAVFSKAIAAFEVREGITRGFPGSASSYSGAFGMMPNPSALRAPGALGAEILATSVLSYLIFALTDADSTVPSSAAPALIGAAVTTLVSVFGPVTGAGMNPARDLGPRLITLAMGWKGQAFPPVASIYTLGPVAGAILGAGLFDLLKAQQ